MVFKRIILYGESGIYTIIIKLSIFNLEELTRYEFLSYHQIIYIDFKILKIN